MAAATVDFVTIDQSISSFNSDKLRQRDTDKKSNKPVGDWTPRLAQISLLWQHGSAGTRPHNILYGSIESAIPENPLVGPNISGLSAIQADL